MIPEVLLLVTEVEDQKGDSEGVLHQLAIFAVSYSVDARLNNRLHGVAGQVAAMKFESRHSFCRYHKLEKGEGVPQRIREKPEQVPPEEFDNLTDAVVHVQKLVRQLNGDVD